MVNRFAAILALAGLAAALAGADYLGPIQIERSRNIMGTAFTITIFDSGLADMERNSYWVDKAFEVIEDISGRMYSQNERSAVWKINHAKAGEAVTLDDDTLFVLQESLRLSRISDGAFDITDVPLKELWGQAKQKGELPSSEAIQAELSKVGYQHLRLDPEAKTLAFQKSGMKISLDEPARGYAADKALLQLKSRGVTSAMIKAGENLRWIGLAPAGRSWRFGIDHPRGVDEYAAILEIDTERATSSTGDYEDFFLFNGRRYPLVIDPKTGSPPMNGVAGVTVTAENIAFANLLSRLLFILGPEKGYEFIERYSSEGIDAIFIEENKAGQLVFSSSENIRGYLKEIRL